MAELQPIIPNPDQGEAENALAQAQRARANAERERDVAERAREIADRSRAAAEEANHLKDQFIATLSHELRTPLNAILGWAQILRGPDVTREDFAEGVESIERNAKAQAQLIEDLLDVSRIISGKMRLDRQPTPMAAAVEAAIASAQPAIEARSIRLVRQIDPDGAIVLGDPGRLQQIAWNFLSNAVKFTDMHGTVTVKLARRADAIEFSVTDTGRGIEPEFLPYVFDRFRQAEPNTTRGKAGLGLGLAIVKQLAEAHGGMVAAASPGIGKGATFSVTLPAHTAASDDPGAMQIPTADEKPAMSRDAALTGLRILLVEDEEDSRIVIARVLQLNGAKVVAETSVADALARLESERFDLLISDIAMPEQDGYDLIKKLRETTGKSSKLPAIALTAFARQDDRHRILTAGYNAHISKPLDAPTLIAAAAKLTGRPTPATL
jgi:signal transduction histidine kinase/ActR/RegA family two-component response regulator